MDRGPAHISRLHEDILHYIFELNADMYLEEESNSSDDGGQTPSDPNDNALNDHALNVIRHTSQIHDYQLLDVETWKALQQPAPHLEFFKVDIEYWGEHQIFPTADPSLFSDEAPSLREFRFTYPRGINPNFTHRAPWLRQLRDVTLIETFALSDILDALIDMPLLESLELQNATDSGPVLRRCVHLPRLSLLMINTITGLRAVLLFLERVVAAPACALVLDTFDGGNIHVTVEDIIALQKIVLRYGSENFGTTAMEGFTFIDIFLDFPVTPGFFGTLQNSPSPNLFSHVKAWNIRDGMFADLEWEINNAGWDGLALFLSLFPFVEILQTPEYSLRVLLAAFQENPCIWSLLHTLRITDYTTLTPSFANTLLRFLDQREGDELPIKVLDVTEWVVQKRQDWGFLERKVGLKVVWVRDGIPSSYICGSGEPTKLKI
ncbi:hypothetical protein GALMADRAFT_135569 [Galerina marginata CBS 339.88]|uniref:F-box domain-containing protein n=1 Tax=Galerina marginata (strain CBS 339.88) TaxID=685588 RepID=A0A067TGB8_GALM3|nr:hypothetical protein GALMADRAFT_135569 [Galerina marginata CBS 339.88]